MSATATQRSTSSQLRSERSRPFFAVEVVALAAALIVRATGVFNVLVFVLLAVLWRCFAAALASARVELNEFWRAFRRRSVLIQAVGWLLFLPVTAALYVPNVAGSRVSASVW